ncbi:hypothetical protein Ato02nite_093300 [Paractinoplanes toevensis]|uniref:Excreted virulence factor EspC (Type VII ESX diderm) n=2 Tax=Paractinoplanes toevensis TaxID=571911 RepID=A0A919WC55_9ACTN|nr:hypothetical protein Ato02nite_093300 [Actinoplanes toevensis]
MPPPDKQQVMAAIDALRKDASTWDAGAAELRDAAGAAGQLQLSAMHFSYLADQLGLTETYQQLQHRLYRLLNEGADNLTELAGALRAAADGYEQDEANAVHRMTGIY